MFLTVSEIQRHRNSVDYGHIELAVSPLCAKYVIANLFKKHIGTVLALINCIACV